MIGNNLKAAVAFQSLKRTSHKDKVDHFGRGEFKILMCWQYSSKGQWKGRLLFLVAKIVAENKLAWKSVLVLLSML